METAIVFNQKILCKQEFIYHNDSGEQIKIDEDLRIGLIESIKSLANGIFNDNIESFIIANFRIVVNVFSIVLESEKLNLTCYSIASKETDHKVIELGHKEIINQFTNRYSFFDIKNKKTKYFRKFKRRFEKILGDIITPPQERLCSIF